MPKTAPVLTADDGADPLHDAASVVAVERRKRIHKRVPPRSRLWGFVRNTHEAGDNSPDMTAQDIGLWLDERRCRFLVAADKKVIDDLAPVEFAQLVRKLRHSTTQILYKYETRHDGLAGRPRCVWPSQQPVRASS